MDDWKLRWDGGCLCGEIRFRISAPPLLTMACHCTGCQKLTASAYSLSLAVPREGFTITRGEPVVGGLHGPHRYDWFVPFVEVAASEGLPWAHTPAVHSFGTQPDPEAYAPLVEAFARDGARPA